jgi:hypothetical protein
LLASLDPMVDLDGEHFSEERELAGLLALRRLRQRPGVGPDLR